MFIISIYINPFIFELLKSMKRSIFKKNHMHCTGNRGRSRHSPPPANWTPINLGEKSYFSRRGGGKEFDVIHIVYTSFLMSAKLQKSAKLKKFAKFTENQPHFYFSGWNPELVTYHIPCEGLFELKFYKNKVIPSCLTFLKVIYDIKWPFKGQNPIFRNHSMWHV